MMNEYILKLQKMSQILIKYYKNFIKKLKLFRDERNIDMMMR